MATLFGNTYETAGIFLALLAIQYVFMAFGNLSLIALFNGQGKTGFVLRIGLVTGLVCFPLGVCFDLGFWCLGFDCYCDCGFRCLRWLWVCFSLSVFLVLLSICCFCPYYSFLGNCRSGDFFLLFLS